MRLFLAKFYSQLLTQKFAAWQGGIAIEAERIRKSIGNGINNAQFKLGRRNLSLPAVIC